jgi:hypothetical protein
VPLTETDWPALGEIVDGFIDDGPKRTTVDAPADVYGDPSYVKEVRRRAKILRCTE